MTMTLHPAEPLEQAIDNLRAHCIHEIVHINNGEGRKTPCFPEINAFLKRCDVVFQAWNHAKKGKMMAIADLDISAFEHPEHAMIAAVRATIAEYGIVQRITVRVVRSDGDWIEHTSSRRDEPEKDI